jgi:hypothetical protein
MSDSTTCPHCQHSPLNPGFADTPAGRFCPSCLQYENLPDAREHRDVPCFDPGTCTTPGHRVAPFVPQPGQRVEITTCEPGLVPDIGTYDRDATAEVTPLLRGTWSFVTSDTEGFLLVPTNRLRPVAACRHCGEIATATAADDGTCARCTLRDVVKGAALLADGEAVDAYHVLAAATSAYLDGKTADQIHDAAFVSAPTKPDFYGRDYIALESDTFAGEPVEPGTLLRWDPTASTHYPASESETRDFALSIGFAPSDVLGAHSTLSGVRGMLAARARQDERRDWISHR